MNSERTRRLAAGLLGVMGLTASAAPAPAAGVKKSRRQLRHQVERLLALEVEVLPRREGYAVVFALPAEPANPQGKGKTPLQHKEGRVVVEPAKGRPDVWIREYVVSAESRGAEGVVVSTRYTGHRTVIKEAARVLRRRAGAARRAAALVARHTAVGQRLTVALDATGSIAGGRGGRVAGQINGQSGGVSDKNR